MTQEIFNAILRTVASFLIIFISAKFVGRKIISQFTFLDFVVGVSIGAITAHLVVGQDKTFLLISIKLIGFAALAVITDLFHLKSIIFRKMVDSKPEILIMNGKIIDNAMKKTRITVDELNMQLREKNIFNIADVEFALIEPDGQLSVLPKAQKQPLTPSDLNIPTKYKGLTKDLIVDGVILRENLQSVNLDEKWLFNQLKTYGIFDTQKVLYAGLDTSGNLYISQKNNNKE